MKMEKAAVGLIALAVGVVLGRAAEGPKLMVGDPAPKLQVSKWMQGDPVKEFEQDKAYIVEFWATWCGPCIASIPHVNELHQKFKDKGLVVIGQDVWENDTSKVEPFIKKMGDKMTYRVALDAPDEGTRGKMAETWMKAAGRRGIPSAFVVDKKGMIAWIGHPMSLKEELLQEVLEGTFDLPKAAAAYEKRVRQESAEESLWQEFNQHVKKKEWTEADAALTKLEKVRPEDQHGDLKLRRVQLLLDQKDFQAAYNLAAQLSEAHPDNLGIQSQLAWKIAYVSKANQDLHLAEKIARRANEAGKGQDPGALNTLAHVLSLKGEMGAAIEYQSKAVEFADESRKKAFQKTLDRYKSAQNGR